MSNNDNGSRPAGFEHSEKEFATLRNLFETGAMTEADLNARMHDLMVRDAQGQWWVIGYQTGHWYVHVGEEWVQRYRPGVSPLTASANATTQAPASFGATLWWPALVAAMGIVFARQISQIAGSFVFQYRGYYGMEIVTVFTVFGAISGFMVAMTVKSLYTSVTWVRVLVIAGGWAVLFAVIHVSIGWGWGVIEGDLLFGLQMAAFTGGGFLLVIALKSARLVRKWVYTIPVVVVPPILMLASWPIYRFEYGFVTTIAGFGVGFATFWALRKSQQNSV